MDVDAIAKDRTWALGLLRKEYGETCERPYRVGDDWAMFCAGSVALLLRGGAEQLPPFPKPEGPERWLVEAERGRPVYYIDEVRRWAALGEMEVFVPPREQAWRPGKMFGVWYNRNLFWPLLYLDIDPEYSIRLRPGSAEGVGAPLLLAADEIGDGRCRVVLAIMPMAGDDYEGPEFEV